MLEDGKKLAELRVENDDVLALCLAAEGGGWEAIEIEEPEAKEEAAHGHT